jgi:hypothetical protein
VTRVTKHPVVEVAEGGQVGGFTIHAKMYVPANEYSTDLYLVKIIEPIGLQYLQPEEGYERAKDEGKPFWSGNIGSLQGIELIARVVSGVLFVANGSHKNPRSFTEMLLRSRAPNQV